MDVAGFGPVHEPCFLPYHVESELKVLVQVRCYSIGDTIAASTVLRELKRLYPQITITVMTFFPDLFKYNPHISGILDLNQPIMQAAIDSHHFKIDAFTTETRHHFAMHSGEFAFQSAFLRSGYPDQYEYEVRYHLNDVEEMLRISRELGITREDRLILVNPHGTEWPTRDWGPIHMQEVVDDLKRNYPFHKIVSVGGKRGESREMKNYVQLEGIDVDAYGKFSLLQSIAFMDQWQQVKLLVTPDTGTLHMGAVCPMLPIVGIFTLVRPYFRTPVRQGRFGHLFIGVESNSGCSCTFDARLLTDETNFKVCPKRTFLEKTLRGNLPKEYKLQGLKNYDPKRAWTPENFKTEVRKDLELFSRKSLPCFPTVDKVLAACDQLLNPGK